MVSRMTKNPTVHAGTATDTATDAFLSGLLGHKARQSPNPPTHKEYLLASMGLGVWTGARFFRYVDGCLRETDS